MTKARNLADLLDANGDVVSGALDNVPASNDASALTTGTIDNALISLDANEIPNLDTSKITTGTFSDARMPSTVLNSNVDLTNLSASNLTSGTLPDARFPSVLPAVSGANLTNLPGGGKVLQVVSATDSTERTTSSTSFTSASNTLSVNITPSATSSKILLICNTAAETSSRSFTYTIFRGGSGGTNLATGAGSQGFYSGERSGGESFTMVTIDSPNTTSSTNYQLFTKEVTSIGDGTTVFNRGRSGDGSVTGVMIAIEIDGS